MIFKKFGSSEIIRNVIKTYPNNDIFVDVSGNQYIKSQNLISSLKPNNSSLYYGNLIVGSTGSYFLKSDAVTTNDPALSHIVPNGINPYYFNYSSDFTINRFLTSSITAFTVGTESNGYYAGSNKYIKSLRNTISWYSSVSPSYNYSNLSSSINNNFNVINVPSIFYGSSIKKGSIKMDMYVTGTLIGTLSDYRMNGELVEVTGSSTGSVAGIVLYDEGVFIMTGSWALNGPQDRYIYASSSTAGVYTSIDYPRWKYFAEGMITSSLLASSSNNITFQGVDYINSITMFAHLDKNEFNTSNNKTFVKTNQPNFLTVVTSSSKYIENKELEIKNTVKTSYSTVSGSFKKQTFINTVGIYDEDRNLLAVAKLATPLKKNNEREYTLKLKLDI